MRSDPRCAGYCLNHSAQLGQTSARAAQRCQCRLPHISPDVSLGPIRLERSALPHARVWVRVAARCATQQSSHGP
eukprot:942678-Alexandrium_andersonii.AAC.1